MLDVDVNTTETSNGLNDYTFSSNTIYSQMVLIGLLTLFSITGNSMIVILIKRFVCLRTISNVALANMAVVDTLNILTNLPGFVLVGVLEMNHILRGKLMSSVIAMSQTFFNNMKVCSMLFMITDRFLAISMGMRYKVWMTKGRMAMSIVLVWVFGISMNVPWFVPICKIDLGDVPTKEYRIAYFQRVGKTASFFVFSICGIAITVICLLTRRSFKKQMKCFEKRQKDGQDLQGTRLNEERTRKDGHAAFTIGLTIAAYVLCYFPAIFYAYFVGDRSNIVKTSEANWFGFVANYFLFGSSACNPFIYIFRSSRLRRATVCFFRSPCGSKDMMPMSQKKKLVNKHVNIRSSNANNKVSPTRSVGSINCDIQDNTRPPDQDNIRPPDQDNIRPQDQDYTRPPDQENTRPPDQDNTRPPDQDNTRPPDQGKTRPPDQDNTRPPNQDNTRPPDQDNTRPPDQDKTRPPDQDNTRPPNQNTTRPPEQDNTRPPNQDNTRPLAEGDILGKAQFRLENDFKNRFFINKSRKADQNPGTIAQEFQETIPGKTPADFTNNWCSINSAFEVDEISVTGRNHGTPTLEFQENIPGKNSENLTSSWCSGNSGFELDEISVTVQSHGTPTQDDQENIPGKTPEHITNN